MGKQRSLISYWTFWAVIGLTLTLGLVGFNWGLPYFLSANEKDHVLAGMNYFLFPDSFITTPFFHIDHYKSVYPPLYHLIMALCSMLFFLFEGIKAFIQTHSLSDTKSLLYFAGYAKSWEIMSLGRLVSVGLSVLNVWMTVKISKLLYDNSVIAIAAGLLASVSLLSVFQAHYAYPNTLTVTMALATIWALIRVIRKPETKNYILAAVMFTLAFNAKWNLLPLILLFPLAFYGATKTAGISPFSAKSIRSACLAALVGCVVFFAIFPTPIFRHQLVLEIFKQSTKYARQGYLPYTGSFGSYIFFPIPQFDEPLVNGSIIQGIGWPVFALGFAGMIVAIFRRRSSELLLVIWLVSYYLFMEYYGMRAIRMMVVLVPPFAILASKLLWEISNGIRTPRWLYYVVLIGIALPSFSLSARFAYEKTLPDTRIVAKDWIEANIPACESILLDSSEPPLEKCGHEFKWLKAHKPHLKALFQNYFLKKKEQGYRLYTLNYSTSEQRGGRKAPEPFSLEESMRDSLHYVVVSSYFRRMFDDNNVKRFYPLSTASWQHYYKELEGSAQRVYQIHPRRWRETGPEIDIYRLPRISKSGEFLENQDD